MAETIALRVSELGYEAVVVRLIPTPAGKVLQVMIDRDGGIGTRDCEWVSREVSLLLDASDWGLASYRLEVTSPGLERPLVHREDFLRFSGRKVTLRMRHLYKGRRHYTGFLKGMAGNDIVIDVDGTECTVPWGDIQRAHLVYEGK